jgi:farnesyl diphosphate synthase
MVGGQMMDIEAETRVLDEPAVRRLQALKTGALLAFSAEAGALLAEADPARHGALAAYGRDLGAAFQIADDVLDASGSAVKMGKAVGKDAAAGKATLVAALGLEGARAEASRLARRAQEALAPFGSGADTLRAAAAFVVARQH